MSELGHLLFFDLEKAKRDVSKLVQVQRMVTRNGKTFPQTVYILPAQVKPTDRVISGQQNLIKKVSKPSKGVWDQNYWDYVSSDPSKRDEALDYLKNSLGIQWSENKNVGINMMRAKMALNDYIKSNNLQGSASGGQKSNSTSAPNKVSPAPKTAAPVQNTQSTGGVKGVDKAISDIALNYNLKQSTRDALKQCKNGREMVDVLKEHEGKDKLSSIAKDSLGVKWDENKHAGINSMRMQMAMYKHLDIIMGTQSPVGSVARGTANPNAGVTNIPKTTQPAAPVPPDDKVPIPKNASQRQVNIINIINGITSESDLDAYAKVGMVAEDETARDWLLSTGLPRYQKWAAAHSSIVNAKNTSSNATRNNGNTPFGFGDQMAYDLKYFGQHKKIVTDAYSDLYNEFDMSMFTNPMDGIKAINAANNDGKSYGNTYSLIYKLNNAFSTYASDSELTKDKVFGSGNSISEELTHETNLGYNGLDHDKLSRQYDLEKEGYVRYLRKIASDNPNNQEIQDKINEMVANYDDMMNKVSGDRKLLYTALMAEDGMLGYDESDYYCSPAYRSVRSSNKSECPRLRDMINNYDRNGDIGSSVQSLTPAAAKVIVDNINHKYESMISYMKSRGMTEMDIFTTLNHTWNDDANRYDLYKVEVDASGKANQQKFDTVDFTNNSDYMAFNPKHTNNGDKDYLDAACQLTREELRVIAYRFMKENSDKLDYSDDTYEWWNEHKVMMNPDNNGLSVANEVFSHVEYMSKLSSDDIKGIKSTCNKMFGVKVVDKNYNEIAKDDKDYYTHGSSSFWSDYKTVGKQAPSNAETTIMSNILMTHLMCGINQSAAKQSMENTRSKINNDGWDYSGNFDWYDGNAMVDSFRRSSVFGSSGAPKRVRHKQIGDSWSNSGVYTADELNAHIDEQLSRMPNLTPEYIQNVHDFYEQRASINAGGGPVAHEDIRKDAAKFNFKSVGIVVDDYVDSPLKDVLYQFSTSYSKSIPKMVETGVDKMETRMAKNLDYLPYDYMSDTQQGLKESKGRKTTPVSVQMPKLRQKREEVLKKIKCSIATEDESTSTQMRKDMLKRWDYKAGDKDCDGNTMVGKKFDGSGMYSDDRRILFNTRFFKINNSHFHENYDNYRAKLIADGNAEANDCTKDVRGESNVTEMELYHGCPVECVTGIIGVTGGWMGAKGSGITAAQQAKNGGSGQALGPGAYFGDRGGKSWVYCGSSSYSMQHSYIDDSNKDGMMVLCKVMRGKSSGGSFNHDMDSTSDHGRFNAFELAVHNNDCIYPHHFVEVSARSLGKNVKRDSQGNYLDSNGNITHDRYGKSIHMK